MSYKIIATYEENGTRLISNNYETLGDAHGKEFATREEAECVAESLASDKPEEFEGVDYEVIEA